MSEADQARSGDEAADHYAEMLSDKLAKHSLRALLPQITQALRLLLSIAPRLFGFVMTSQLFRAGILGAQVLLTKRVFDALLAESGAATVLPLVLLIVVLNGVASALGSLQGQFQMLLSELVVRETWMRVLRVATTVPLMMFERPSFYDRLQRITANALTKPLQLAQGAVGFVGGALGVTALLVALISIEPLVVPILLIAVVPLLVVARLGGHIEFEFALNQTRNVRERFALIDLLIQRSPAKEVRAFALSTFVSARYQDRYDTYLKAYRHKVKRRSWLAILSAVIGSVVAGVAVTLLVVLITQGRISLSVAGASIAAVVLLSSQLQQLLSGVSSMLEAGLYVRDLEDFEKLATPVVPPLPKPVLHFDRVEVRNVSLTYPGQEEPALRDVSFSLSRGEVIAVVGPNGSGKTTLSKVLGNLYPATEGCVVWDGEDVTTLDADEVARSVTLLFQDFVRYELSAHENVAVGDSTAMEDRERVIHAAREAGAHEILSRLPSGYDSFMSTRFPNGVDLSTGQWQRVAMARALFRDAPLVILDEPTAALDARAEMELYETMQRVLKGRSVVLVTHRLASARHADQILVLDNGAVVEQGTHHDLMARGGYYADMFLMQASAFGLEESGGV